MCADGSKGFRGREGKLMERVSASMRTSRAVITQSTSRIGGRRFSD